MSRTDYESTCLRSRLADGSLWPIPIVLDVPDTLARSIGAGCKLALRDPEGVMLAALHVQDVWQPDLRVEAELVYGTTSCQHPGVASLLEHTHPSYVGGKLEGIQLPSHHDFKVLRRTPAELRAEFERRGWNRIAAFHTRNFMHRVHYELTLRAAEQLEANLLIHPSLDMANPGDVEHYARVRCYQKLLTKYPTGIAQLALLPLATRRAGPREAVWHAIIRKNYGCSHFIVGFDHAGAGTDERGKPFYEPQVAAQSVVAHQPELGIDAVAPGAIVYSEKREKFVEESEMPPGTASPKVPRAEVRRRLERGMELPAWFTFDEVAQELRRSFPPRCHQGFTVFFTGLSGSGKSTIANILRVKFLEMGGRSVTLLDGDLVRKHLSSELGFSKEHRDINIRRIGFVASEITKGGGIAICAPIAPYDAVRKEVRATVEPHGGFVLVYLSTGLAVCEARDRKGLYAKARAGIVKEFTGISDPYEVPADAEIVLDTSELTPEQAAQEIFSHLKREGFILQQAASAKASQ